MKSAKIYSNDFNRVIGAIKNFTSQNSVHKAHGFVKHMMDDKTLAILGDQAAAERITREGLLLECPFCHENPTTRVKIKSGYIEMSVVCFKCGISKATIVEICDTDFEKMNSGMKMAVREWNTRAPILTPTQLALLRIAEEPRAFEEESK